MITKFSEKKYINGIAILGHTIIDSIIAVVYLIRYSRGREPLAIIFPLQYFAFCLLS